MKLTYLISFAVLLGFSVVAWVWQPRSDDRRIDLVWTSDDNPARREQVALFNRLNPRYRLRLDPQNATMEKVIVQSLAGVGPDVFDCYDGFQLMAYVQSGIAWDCDAELRARGIAPTDYWPCVYPCTMLDGKMYGTPNNASAPAIWYNKKLLREQGIPYPKAPWTWGRFIETARRLTRRDARGRLIRCGMLMNWLVDWNITIFQFGARFYAPEGTRCVLDSPAAGQAMQFLQDLTFKYRVAPTPSEEAGLSTIGGWGTGSMTQFAGAQAAMTFGGRYWLCILRDEAYRKLELGAVQMPTDGLNVVPGVGRSTLINANSRHKEGALEFLLFLHGKEFCELINHQADAICAVKKYAYTDAYLHDPGFPAEDYNDVWRAALETAIPQEVSPYVNGVTAFRILSKQVDLVKNQAKTGAEAMRDAAKKINREIVEGLRMNPDLRKRYMRAIAAGAPPAWDRPEDAP
ncbi:MAG: extracellular solute-binding protein [bacterium]|nr:extracellular solute-binding protein [bacterium]